MLHSNGESKSFGMGFGVISYMSKMIFCKISKRLINTSNKRLNNLYNPIANSHPTAVRETLKKKQLDKKGRQCYWVQCQGQTTRQTVLTLIFLMLCPQQGINTWHHKKLWRDNHLTTKNSRVFIGHLIHMNSSSVERGLELDIPVSSRNQTSLLPFHLVCVLFILHQTNKWYQWYIIFWDRQVTHLPTRLQTNVKTKVAALLSHLFLASNDRPYHCLPLCLWNARPGHCQPWTCWRGGSIWHLAVISPLVGLSTESRWDRGKARKLISIGIRLGEGDALDPRDGPSTPTVAP